MNKLLKLLVFTFLLNGFCLAQSNNLNVESFQYISPVPGSGLHNPETNIIIRQGEALNPFDLNDTSLITVVGSSSGLHSGSLYITPDSKTIIFQPNSIFVRGETVYVSFKSGLTTTSGVQIDSLHFFFNVSVGFPNETNSANYVVNDKQINSDGQLHKSFYLSNSDSSILSFADFPKISITGKNKPEEGYYFFSFNTRNKNFLTIINNSGIPIFIKQFIDRTYSFTIQKNGMLTYWDDKKTKFYEMDSLYQIVDSFYCGNGYSTDYHALQVLPNGHSFVLATDTQPVNMDTVVAGGVDTAHVTGNIIQEIDNEKRVIWQWRSWDNVNITDTDPEFDLTLPIIRYCHINSIEVVDEDNIIISIRHFNEITGINRKTGKIKWRFGGKKNQFNNDDPRELYHQHDARFLSNNKISVLDNGDLNTSNSRAVIYQLDTTNFTTHLVKEIYHVPVVWGKVMGNVQHTKKRNIIVDWGHIGYTKFYTSEYDSVGNLTNDLTFTSTNYIYSYRSFKFPWRTRVFISESDTIAFQNVSAGNQANKVVKIFNNTSVVREISGFYNKKNEFMITDNFPITIPPNGDISLNFQFDATDSQEIIDTLYLVSKSADEMIALPIILIGNQHVTNIENQTLKIPVDFELAQNYPNPFNPITLIDYSVPEDCILRIRIYNLLGEEILELVNQEVSKGNYSIEWNAEGVSSGVYFYVLEALAVNSKKNVTLTRKMLLMK
jgi:hypothetical protein